jgi:hypothetical protein
MTAIAIGVCMVLAFLGAMEVILLGIERRKALAKARQSALEASAPTSWVQVGVGPPPGASVALEACQASYTHLPSSGTIEWVEGPYQLPPMGLVAGNVASFKPVYIKLMWAEKVEQTALAHELLHVEDHYANNPPRESPGNKAFVAEFQAVNAVIAHRLGR